MKASILFLLCAASAHAFAPGVDKEEALKQLRQESELITSIEPYVERLDLSRLYVLRTAVTRVTQAVTTNGLGHKSTFQEYQNHVVSFRYSSAFFKRIETRRTKEWLVQLQGIAKAIEENFGFDDSPYTQITASVFTQMHKLILELEQLAISDGLRAKLGELKAPIGNVVAVAKQGDRPKAFEAALPVYQRIKGLYGDFFEVASSSAAFSTVMEIQGLNEFYGEFAQVTE